MTSNSSPERDTPSFTDLRLASARLLRDTGATVHEMFDTAVALLLLPRPAPAPIRVRTDPRLR